MAEVIIYTTNYCTYCVRAKDLLKKKGVAFKESDITNDNEMREKLVEITGGRKTVPQIFIDNKHIGGCDDLYALESQGKLNSILGI